MNFCKGLMLYALFNIESPIDIVRVQVSSVSEFVDKFSRYLGELPSPTVSPMMSAVETPSAQNSLSLQSVSNMVGEKGRGQRLANAVVNSLESNNKPEAMKFFGELCKYRNTFGYIDIDETIIKGADPMFSHVSIGGKYGFENFSNFNTQFIMETVENKKAPYENPENLTSFFISMNPENKQYNKTKDFESFLFSDVLYQANPTLLEVDWIEMLKNLKSDFRYFSAAHPDSIEKRFYCLKAMGLPVDNPYTNTPGAIYTGGHGKNELGQMIRHYNNIEHHGPLTDKVDWFKSMKGSPEVLFFIDDQDKIVDKSQKNMQTAEFEQDHPGLKKVYLVHYTGSKSMEKKSAEYFGDNFNAQEFEKKWKQWIENTVSTYLDDLAGKQKIKKNTLGHSQAILSKITDVAGQVTGVADKIDRAEYQINRLNGLLESMTNIARNSGLYIANHQASVDVKKRHRRIKQINAEVSSNDRSSSNNSNESKAKTSTAIASHDESSAVKQSHRRIKKINAEVSSNDRSSSNNSNESKGKTSTDVSSSSNSDTSKTQTPKAELVSSSSDDDQVILNIRRVDPYRQNDDGQPRTMVHSLECESSNGNQTPTNKLNKVPNNTPNADEVD